MYHPHYAGSAFGWNKGRVDERMLYKASADCLLLVPAAAAARLASMYSVGSPLWPTSP